MTNYGFNGYFFKKGGQVDEGLATLYRTEKFRFIESSSVFLPDALHNDSKYSYILDKVKHNERLLASLTQRTTTISIVVLEQLSTGKILIVGNTHLYFEPNADHIRLIQAEMCRVEIESGIGSTVNKYLLQCILGFLFLRTSI